MVSGVDKRLSCIVVILFICILIAFYDLFRIYHGIIIFTQLDEHCLEAAWQLDKHPGNCHMMLEPITWINHTIVSMAKSP